MLNLRDNVQVILVEPRFPENIGMVARACGNMGVSRLVLVKPELWGGEYSVKARLLASGAGEAALNGIAVYAGLDEALAGSTLCFGSTARIGGWRQGVVQPARAAELAAAHLNSAHAAGGGRVDFVFGPEDKGLSNADIEKCSYLINIPTASEPSLNLAQAVLLILYELARALPFAAELKAPRPGPRSGKIKSSPLVSHEESELLLEKMREAMLALESLPEDNSGYFMLPLRRLVKRVELKHNEFSILMGVCNKILRLKALAGAGKK